jgi:predicted nucleotidyltransferase
MHQKIVNLITQHYPNTKLIYLFGSQASGQSTNNSDWDIAIFNSEKLEPLARWELSESLCNLLNSEVDLVDLLQASTVLQMQIISTGKLLYNAESYADSFEMQVFSMYGHLQESRSEIIESFISEAKNA